MNPNTPNNPDNREYRPYFDPSLFPPPPTGQVYLQPGPQGYSQPPPQVYHQPGFAAFSHLPYVPGFAAHSQVAGQSQPPPEHDFVSPTHPERDLEEVVPETQPKGKGKKKKKTKAGPSQSEPATGPAAPKPWTMEQELALAKAFIDHSENSIIGNSQPRERFWYKITEKWHELVGRKGENYRSLHQLYSKWRDLNGKISKFNGIYANLLNQRRSGMSDLDVLNAANNEYRLKSFGQVFDKSHVWEAVKNSPKWFPVPEEDTRSSKRSKTSETNEYSPGASDARSFHVDLGLDEDQEENVPEPIRPRGRDKAKRAASSSQSSVAEKLEVFNNIQMEKLKLKQQALALKEQQEAENFRLKQEAAVRKDLKAMVMPTDHLEEDHRAAVKIMMDQIAKKYTSK